MAKLAEDKGQWQRAADLYERALTVDDLGEPFYAGTMRCAEKMGRPAEALRQYERCRSVLKAKVGVGPALQTNAAYQRIRERFVKSD